MVNEFRYLTADVFTDEMFGGNQLAVFPDARGLDEATMQKIARELNLSETVFVLPAETPQGTRRLRIFTPGSELPFAGHPTVGTAFVLASIGEIPPASEPARVVFEEGVGPVAVLIEFSDGRPVFSQLSAARMPEEGAPPPASRELAAVISLEPSQILDGEWRPRSFSCGVPYLFVTVRDLAALGEARVKIDLWERYLSGYAAPEIYLLTEMANGDVRARMFAPGIGIQEDAATGSAAAALAGYLAPPNASDGTLQWTVRQGVEMGRPSTLQVEADFAHGAISAVRVGGSSVMVSEGVLRLRD